MKIKGVSKIYIINLNKCTERYKRIKYRLLEIYKLDDDYIERFPAVETTDPRIPLEASEDLKKVMACSLSHEDVWRLSVSSGNGYSLIMEDDVYFRKDWINVVESFLVEGPLLDFELLMINGSALVDCTEGLRKIGDKRCLLTGAYIITINAMQKLLWNYRLNQPDISNYDILSIASDYRLVWLQGFYRSFYYFPWLALQENIDSDITTQDNANETKKWFDTYYLPWYSKLYDLP